LNGEGESKGYDMKGIGDSPFDEVEVDLLFVFSAFILLLLFIYQMME
jgi:hypothetical protein